MSKEDNPLQVVSIPTFSHPLPSKVTCTLQVVSEPSIPGMGDCIRSMLENVKKLQDISKQQGQLIEKLSKMLTVGSSNYVGEEQILQTKLSSMENYSLPKDSLFLEFNSFTQSSKATVFDSNLKIATSKIVHFDSELPYYKIKYGVHRASGNRKIVTPTLMWVEDLESKHAKYPYTCTVEHQIAAIRAIGHVEIECLLTGLRLLHSNFSKEQLQTPVLQLFKENLPNLSFVQNEKDIEVAWKDKDGKLSMSHAGEGNIHMSLLQRMSIAYPDCTASMAAFGGFEFSSKSVKSNILGAGNPHISDLALEEPSDTHMLGFQDAFQTPGMSNQRLSLGMTPKTLRLPKHGEMILSGRGSPLGVYKEENMEAIHETEEG
ncbi:hypothetical protein HHK36_021099 [Tetracentron sinense]|uniref:Uncharacterized protein n=1 Tax=Tetracentron sinense TaxID=13715 RepID=A0A834YSH2_TETSI|nr:hypothetical protein HHK36_021099 [Tetracentron sinense]